MKTTGLLALSLCLALTSASSSFASSRTESIAGHTAVSRAEARQRLLVQIEEAQKRLQELSEQLTLAKGRMAEEGRPTSEKIFVSAAYFGGALAAVATIFTAKTLNTRGGSIDAQLGRGYAAGLYATIGVLGTVMAGASSGIVYLIPNDVDKIENQIFQTQKELKALGQQIAQP